jgi:hypothetical protein
LGGADLPLISLKAFETARLVMGANVDFGGCYFRACFAEKMAKRIAVSKS